MFKSCVKLTTVTNLKCTISNASEMFYGCSKLSTVDLSYVTFENCDCSEMFSNSNVTNITLVAGSISDAGWMFAFCNNLELFDSGFVTFGSATSDCSVRLMFISCPLLTECKLWNLKYLTYFDQIFTYSGMSNRYNHILYANQDIVTFIDDKNVQSDKTYTLTAPGNTFALSQICFEENTLIQTEKGLMPIKDLKRGDVISTRSGPRPLALLMMTPCVSHTFVKFPAHCFGLNVPIKDTLCTPPHPVGVNFKQVPASEFVGKVEGVCYETIETSAYYNLQFDTPEWLCIQGMWFTSHHPTHVAQPLPRCMYIDAGKYRQGKFYEEVYRYEDVVC